MKKTAEGKKYKKKKKKYKKVQKKTPIRLNVDAKNSKKWSRREKKWWANEIFNVFRF